MKNDSSDDVSSGFENLFKSDPACYEAQYSKYKYCMTTLARKAKSHEMNCHEIKIATDFNVANSVRCENKVLTIKPTIRYST